MSSTTLLATDQQRSVLITLKTNHSPQPIGYSPYGYRPAACWLLSLLGFNGELADPLTGHYLLGNGYRAFNPVSLRFNSPDNLSPFGEGGLNSYAYCLGDPINLLDKTGHSALKIWRDITLTIIARSKISKLIAASDADGLRKIQSSISQLITDRKTKNFVQLHSDTNKSYLQRFHPQKLEALALEQFQKSSHRISAPVPPKYKNLPRIIESGQPKPTTAQLQENLNSLNKAAHRDASGSVTNYSVMRLRRDHRKAIFEHENLRRPKQLLLEIDAAIEKVNLIRSS
ncbi:RHS repeat-associated core domain-containing protein [Pseudomonas putida]|uniref:RHS repeat-associated core domain-containing protein n=1 Tax=Pseudomonas putida TaxID=303 RepID=UPI003D979BD3